MTGYDYAEQLANELLAVINGRYSESNSLEALAAAAMVFDAVGRACTRPELNPAAQAVRAVLAVQGVLSNMMSVLEMEHQPAPEPRPHFAPGPRGPQ